MALYQSRFVTRQESVIGPDCAGDVVANVFEVEISTLASLATGDIIELGVLPAGSIITDAILDVDKLDTNGTPAVSLDVGIMSGDVGVNDAGRTCGNEIYAADTTARAGGISRLTKQSALRIARTGSDRSVGVKVVAAPATKAASGKIRLTLFIAG